METQHLLEHLTGGLVAAWMLTAATAIFLRKPFIHEAITRLGYPAYFPYFLGAAKLVGAALILLPVAPMFKQFAFAGVAFELLAATVSYGVVDRKPTEWLKPLALLVLVATAYFLWKAQSGLPTWG